MSKDLATVKGETRAHEVQLPVTELVDSFYEEVQAMGGGRGVQEYLLLDLGKNRWCL